MHYFQSKILISFRLNIIHRQFYSYFVRVKLAISRPISVEYKFVWKLIVKIWNYKKKFRYFDINLFIGRIYRIISIEKASNPAFRVLSPLTKAYTGMNTDGLVADVAWYNETCHRESMHRPFSLATKNIRSRIDYLNNLSIFYVLLPCQPISSTIFDLYLYVHRR